MILHMTSATVDRACLLVAKFALIGMALTVLLQIWARYGLNYPLSWTEELARYCMIWAGLLGATCAFKRRLDPAVVSLSINKLTPLHRAILAATVVTFLAPILYYSLFGPDMNFERGFLWRSNNRTSPGLGLNMAAVGAIVPLSCLVILLHLTAQIFPQKASR